MNARYLESAKIEFADAIAYHDNLSATLGTQFQRAIHKAVEQIIEFPLRFPRISGEYRRCRVGKFKYGIVYLVEDDELVIVAFMHLHRDPAYWESRKL